MMAKTKMTAGAEIETLTPPELAGHLDRFTKDWYQEKARGVTTFRFDSTAAVTGAGALTVPATAQPVIGPKAGFAWAVQSGRVQGLLSGDSLNVFRNSSQVPGNFVGQLSAAAPTATFGSKGLILRGEEKLIVVGASLMATGDVTVNFEGIEVPDSDLYKLL
jgi:hypothetical protein